MIKEKRKRNFKNISKMLMEYQDTSIGLRRVKHMLM